MNLYNLPLDNPFEIPSGIYVSLKHCGFSDDFQQNIQTAFIYLRNIQYKQRIYFDDLTAEQKFIILKKYIFREIHDFDLKQLDYTVFSLYFIYDREITEKGIFSQEQILQFYKENTELCGELASFMISLPLYIFYRLKQTNCGISFANIIHEDKQVKFINAMYELIKYTQINYLFMLQDFRKRYQLKFYTKVFYKDNQKLMDLLKGTVFCQGCQLIFRDI